MKKEQEVILLQYDLTGGMATKIVKFMTGLDIEGIWHTSLVIYGKEYFFGGGICKGEPRNTPYGTPLKESVFGTTNKTEEEFNEYLQSIDNVYNAENYHLLNNNCNHFTNAICQFLCGKPLPDEIVNQHKVLADTPFGKWLIPRLEAMSNKMSQAVPNIIEGNNNN